MPALAIGLMARPLKGAENPNTALLFAGFLATPNGQALWSEFQSQTSILAEGSISWKFVQGKETLTLDEAFIAKEFGPRTAKYGEIFGYR